MANPSSIYPAGLYTPPDIGAFAGQKLGLTTPTLTGMVARLAVEVAAIEDQLGINFTPGGGGGGGAVTEILVAAVDAPADQIAAADFTCDGTADNVQIQSAVDAAEAAGGFVRLSLGTFAIATAVSLTGPADVDDTKSVFIVGCGQEGTILNCANNTNGFTITQNYMTHIWDMRINVTGSGDGIASLAGGSNTTFMRSFWHSSFKNLHISGGYSSHTGWGMNLGSPFRSVFENLEIDGVKNGIKTYSEYAAFNPGDCVYERIFVELYGGSGIAYSIDSPSGKGSMNQSVYIMCEAIAAGTGSTGVYIGGVAGSNHNRMIGTNLEEFDTLVNVDNGQGNEIECNFITTRGANSLTAFKTGTGSFNNIFRAKMVYSANTLTLINDGNTAILNEPNIFEDIKIYADTGATINYTVVSGTIMRNIVGDGPGTFSAGVRRYQATDVPLVVTLVDGATPALDASLGETFKLTAAGNRTIAVPSNPTDGQEITIEHVASGGARTLALNTGTGGFAFGTDITALSATGSGLTDFIRAKYSSTANKWRVLAYIKGF